MLSIWAAIDELDALDSEEFAPKLEVEHQLPLVLKSAELIGVDNDALSEKVRRKQGKFLKATEHFKSTEIQRKNLGLPQRHPRTEGGAA